MIPMKLKMKCCLTTRPSIGAQMSLKRGFMLRPITTDAYTVCLMSKFPKGRSPFAHFTIIYEAGKRKRSFPADRAMDSPDTI
jgi:hypothetical protein